MEEIKQIFKRYKVNIKNKLVLELGPGNSYVNAYGFLIGGAKKVILVDKFPRYLKSKRQKEYFKKELDFIKRKYKRKKLFFISNNKIDPKHIFLHPKDITEILVRQKVDFIFSKSVLEHIKNIREAIKKMSGICKSGGYMFHSIDLRDHYNFSNPFLFYKYTDSFWNNCLTKEGISYTNRWRYDDFIGTFKKYGFKIIWEKKTTEKLPGSLKLAKKFKEKSKNNLEITILNILLKKL